MTVDVIVVRLRPLAEAAGDAGQPVVGDGAGRVAEVGDLERHAERVLLDVERVRGVQAQRGGPAEEHRVTEPDDTAVADRGGGADAPCRDVAVGKRGGDVAARDDGRRVGRCLSARPADHVGVALTEVVPVGVLALGEALGGQPGDAERHRQLGEALGRLAGRDVAAAGDLLGEPLADLDLPGRVGVRQVVVHLLERRNAGDRRRAVGQPVGHGADQPTVLGVDRRAGHAGPDAADPVDLRRGEVHDHHVEPRRDSVLEYPDDLARERLGRGALADREPLDRILGLEVGDRERLGAVGSRLRRPSRASRERRHPGHQTHGCGECDQGAAPAANGT